MFLHSQRSLMFAYMSIFQLYTHTQRRRGESVSLGTGDVIHSCCSQMNPFDHALMLPTVSGVMVQ